MTYPREVINRRTGERCCFYNDQTDTDDDGSPTGKGYLQCDIYGPMGEYIGNFPEGGGGIGGILADDGPIGAMFTRNPTSILEVRFPGGSFRSWDEGRTWAQTTAAPTPQIRAWNARLRQMRHTTAAKETI